MAYEIGVVGLGVMGANLSRNMAGRGFGVVGYDLDPAKIRGFAEQAPQGAAVAESLARLAAMLDRPRRLLIMVPAGEPVDRAIDELLPYLEAGDVVIDGGNSDFRDSDRRSNQLAAFDLRFLGVGISGGDKGALRGPAIMAGGTQAAWEVAAPILTTIAAKADDGDICAGYMGPGGAGHYVKMVHNGIEYGDMQLIAESYDLLHRGAGCSVRELAAIFRVWNQGEVRSYLLDVTIRVLEQIDTATGEPLVESILDEADQKGTGKWMSQSAFELGAPVPTVNAAVEARILSSFKHERVLASKTLQSPCRAGTPLVPDERARLVEATRQALYASRIALYAQGMVLLRRASQACGYFINPADVAGVWRAGCILRGAILPGIRAAFERDGELVNLTLDDTFRDALATHQEPWRDAVRMAIELGVPVPALSASLGYYDSYRSATLPANLTQGQRDVFGAHTYRCVDRDGSFHANWSSPLRERRV